MKFILYIIIIQILILSNEGVKGQFVSVGFGPTFLVDKEINKLPKDILGEGIGNDNWAFQLKYGHFLSKNLLIYFSFSKYPVLTQFHFYKENAGGSSGWSGTGIKRIDVGLFYDVFHKSKFILHPNLGFGLQRSTPNGFGCICGDIPDGIKPDNFELLKDIDAFSYATTQLVPVVGLKFGYAFWGRLQLFMDIQQVFGFKKVQELRMDYTYKGVQQPQAISYSDGTGRFWSLGLGFNFVKRKEKNAKSRR
jgi:hypothetical protein